MTKNRRRLSEKAYEKMLKRVREYAHNNPIVNNKATKKWEENNTRKSKIIKRTSWRGTRKRILEMWGPICPMCGREFSDKGARRSICHHIQYEPVEHVIVLCNQCHNLVHNRTCYRHPFYYYADKDYAPFIMAKAILETLNRFVLIIHKPKNIVDITLEVIKDEKEK